MGRLIAISVLLLCSGVTASVAQSSNSISGHIFNEQRGGIPDLQVELLNDVDSVIQRTKTDSSGLYAFRRLTTGIFQVRVQTYGTDFIGQTQRVQLEPTRAFEQVDFTLTTKKTLATSGTAGAIFVQEVPEQAKKEYERGASLLQKNDKNKEAIALLKNAIALYPNYFDALELLGSEYVKAKEYESAVPLLTTAVEVNKRSYHSLYVLSIAQFNLQQPDEAIESIRRAVTLNQGSVNANLWLGTLLRMTHQLEEAETYLKQADKLADAKSADVHWQLALLYKQLKKNKETADELELFLKVQPDSRDAELIKKLIKQYRQ